MVYASREAEHEAVLTVARQICAAIRTAPKTRGLDYLESCILTGEDLERLADKMDELSNARDLPSFRRDAANLRVSQALVLVGVKNVRRGLGAFCGYCGMDGCDACAQAGAECAFGPMDLGIALGSAVALASDAHIDNRLMYSAGRAAMELGILPPEYGCCVAIPLSVSGKSPYFDRK